MVTKGMRVGKYELGRTLGEGNSAKVKLATDTVSGQSFAVKIIDKLSIKRLNVSFQVLFCFLLISSRARIYMFNGRLVFNLLTVLSDKERDSDTESVKAPKHRQIT